MIAFLPLSLPLLIQLLHFGSFSSPHSPTPAQHPVLAYDRIFAAFADSPHSTVAFWQLFLSQHSPTPSLPPVLAYDRIFAAFTHSKNSTVIFWQLLRNRSIRRSQFGNFSTFRIPPRHRYPPFSRTMSFLLLSLPLCIRRSHFASVSSRSILPRRPCPLFSRTIAFLWLSLTLRIQQLHFGNFCTIIAFDSRNLATFPPSAFSHAAPATRSRVRSYICRFRSL